jgi:uncharacterized membrane protein
MLKKYAIFILLLIGCVIRLAYLDRLSIWLDEATSLQVAEKSLIDIINGVGFDRATPPAYYLLLHYWLQFWNLLPSLGLSDSEKLRGLSVLLDLINLCLIWLISFRLMTFRGAIISTSLAVFSPYLIYYAQEGRMYSLLLTEVLICTMIVFNAMNRPLYFKEALIILLVGITGMYTHYYFPLFFIALSLAVIIDDRFKSKRSSQWFALGALVAISFIPWISVLTKLAASDAQSFRKFTIEVLPYTFLRFVVGYGIMPLSMGAKTSPLQTLIQNLPLLIPPLLLFAFVLIQGLIRIFKLDRRVALYLLLPLLLPALLALGISLKIPLLSERYLIVSYPFFLLCACYGILQLRFSMIGWGLCCIVFMFGHLQQLRNPVFGNTDWRTASHYIEQSNASLPIVVQPHFFDECIRRNFSFPVRFATLDDPLIHKAEDVHTLQSFWLLAEEGVDPRLEEIAAAGFTHSKELYLPQGNGLLIRLYERSKKGF